VIKIKDSTTQRELIGWGEGEELILAVATQARSYSLGLDRQQVAALVGDLAKWLAKTS
jgi:hypothetical protein